MIDTILNGSPLQVLCTLIAGVVIVRVLIAIITGK